MARHQHNLACLDGNCPSSRKSVRPMTDRVLDEIAQHQGTINNAMIAASFRVRYETIVRAAKKLQTEGRIERDDNDAWVLTNREASAQAEDVHLRRMFPSTTKA